MPKRLHFQRLYFQNGLKVQSLKVQSLGPCQRTVWRQSEIGPGGVGEDQGGGGGGRGETTRPAPLTQRFSHIAA